MMDMEQGASMGGVKLLMMAFHSIAPWFGCGFFSWLEQKVPVPSQTYKAEGTWF
jgi:hypothetical protein